MDALISLIIAWVIKRLTLKMQPVVLRTEQKNCLKFVTFLHLLHKLMNQYQSCVYLFECIFRTEPKYDHEIPQF